MTLRRRSASRANRAVARKAPVPLDATARDFLARTARVLSRCGHSREDLLNAFAGAVASVPTDLKRLPPASEREMLDAPHLLTHWHNDRAFVDEDGKPRKLRWSGKAGSIEALCRRTRRGMNAKRALKTLLRTGAVKHRGGWYWPIRRSVMLYGIAGPATFRNVRGAAAMLSTNEHNLSELEPWFERTVENPKYPLSEMPAFRTFLEEEGEGFLNRIDEFMRESEKKRRRSRGATVRLGVGVFRYQFDPVRRVRKRRRSNADE